MTAGNVISAEEGITGKTNLSVKQQADVYFSMGRSAEKQENLQEAIRMYQAVLQKDPKHGEANWRLGVCMDKTGNFQKSAVHYQNALINMPGNAQIYCDYGYSLALQKNWNESEINLKQSIAIQPDLTRAHNNLGLVLAQSSRLEDAFREFQLGGLNAADAHWNLGQMLISQSRWDEAKTELEKIRQYNPKDARIEKELSSLNRMVAKLNKIQKQMQTDPAIVRVSTGNQSR